MRDTKKFNFFNDEILSGYFGKTKSSDKDNSNTSWY